MVEYVRANPDKKFAFSGGPALSIHSISGAEVFERENVPVKGIFYDDAAAAANDVVDTDVVDHDGDDDDDDDGDGDGDGDGGGDGDVGDDGDGDGGGGCVWGKSQEDAEVEDRRTVLPQVL